MPYVNSPHAPMAAPAVLKACLTQNNISCTAMDLNIEVLVKVNTHPKKDLLEDFFYKEIIHDCAVEYISQIIFYCANRILASKPTIVGLSLLTFQCQVFTTWLCIALRELCPECKIVIGGSGMNVQVANLEDTYKEKLKNRGLIDDFIVGDGEYALIEYIKGNKDYPGINSNQWTQNVVLDSLPKPDYSDYNFFLYSTLMIPIVDAKGCVRRCEFCDVIEHWSKFQQRKATNIFEEMLFQISKYGLKNFDFRSSISNGNLKEFTRLLELIAEYNAPRYRSDQISWNGSFIVRPSKQHPESLWELISVTNGTLSLGIESAVPTVRTDLGKHFSNEDVDYHFEMAKKYNVKLIIMIITGYPTETIKDYEFTKQWFRDRKQYANNPIVSLMLNPIGILPGTLLARKSLAAGIKDIDTIDFWVDPTKNISVTQRYDYHKDLCDICENECGFNLDGY